MKTIEIIGMVYKSIEYTEHIVNELSRTITKFNETKPYDYEATFRIIGNDPTKAIKEFLINEHKRKVPLYKIYHDPAPEDYYLNRVYRCWNHAGFTSKADTICFVNSDMMFSEGWLENLLKHHNGKYIPCSRLVESGKLLSGQYAISKNFGRRPYNLQPEAWEAYVQTIKEDRATYGGLFMPCLFETERFIESKGYPEGNIYVDGPGTLNGPVLQSGDDWYFRKLETEYGMVHMTIFDSLVYHIQEGEKDE